MSYTIVDPQPALGAGETAVALDDGTLVAVSVSSVRQSNGAGVDFSVSARCINADGTNLLCPTGSPIVTSFTHSSDVPEIDRLTVDAIAKDMLLGVLGEPPRVMSWDAGFLDHVSIRKALEIANATGTKDPTSLL